MPRLRYTTAILSESMRLFPPVWVVGRRAIEDVVIGDYEVPRRTIVIMSQYVIHRDPRVAFGATPSGSGRSAGSSRTRRDRPEVRLLSLRRRRTRLHRRIVRVGGRGADARRDGAALAHGAGRRSSGRIQSDGHAAPEACLGLRMIVRDALIPSKICLNATLANFRERTL